MQGRARLGRVSDRMKETGGWTRAWRATAYVSGLPIFTIAGGLLGAVLDRWLETGPFLAATFGLLGFVAAVADLARGNKNLR